MSRLDPLELLAFFLAAKPGLDIVCNEQNKVVLSSRNEELELPCQVDNVIFRVNEGMEDIRQRITYYVHCEYMATKCDDMDTIWLYGGLRKFLGSERFKELLKMIEGQFVPDQIKSFNHSHSRRSFPRSRSRTGM